MGRVWPRHRHRGRPLNSIVRFHEVTTVPVLRTVGELFVLLVISLGLSWWFVSAMGWVNPTPLQQIARVFFLLYLPVVVPVAAIFEALGPMHKAWLMLAVLIAVSVQNVLMWFGAKWAMRKWRGSSS